MPHHTSESHHRVPAHLARLTYDGAVHPDAPGARHPDHGANCQVFAYLLLEHHGLHPPWLRSSELFDDTEHTQHAWPPEPLDLVMVHRRPVAYGAHVAVCVGSGWVTHLAREPGRVVTERLEDMARPGRYSFLIGAKRVRRGATAARGEHG
ncbi:MAG: hypothetical protein KTR31_32710 [Myxococcales bacterium]|nr:hypothetical protein [Myxococcales bacterium]